jgi:hypothetical protein
MYGVEIGRLRVTITFGTMKMVMEKNSKVEIMEKICNDFKK